LCEEIAGRLETAETPILEQKNTVYCYARGDKAWVTDPQGITDVRAGDHFLARWARRRYFPASLNTVSGCVKMQAREVSPHAPAHQLRISKR
jgi:hypothetical protein